VSRRRNLFRKERVSSSFLRLARLDTS
jgi:hypothetical protein